MDSTEKVQGPDSWRIVTGPGPTASNAVTVTEMCPQATKKEFKCMFKNIAGNTSKQVLYRIIIGWMNVRKTTKQIEDILRCKKILCLVHCVQKTESK